MKPTFLDFEQPIAELQAKIDELRYVHEDSAVDISDEITRLQKKSNQLTKEIYSKLTAWQIAMVARHPQRPYTLDYINSLFSDFRELHGDRSYADDPAIVGGLARFNGRPCMGEPLANYDNVVAAMRVMLDDNAYGLSRRRVTLSTSGLVPALDRLREDCPVALAVSLHAGNDPLRDRLVPINRKYPIRELLAASVRYLDRAPRDFVTFEYVMLDGVNDSEEQARELAALVRDVPCKINLIPWNPFPGADFATSPRSRILAFQKTLIDAGFVTTIRKTRGEDIDAACGQLAGRVQDRTKRQIRIQRAAAHTATH